MNEITQQKAVLIVAPITDMHAAVVKYWLTQLGIECQQWDSEIGFDTPITFKSEIASTPRTHTHINRENLNKFSVIWNRRFNNRAPDTRVPENDRKFVRAESSIFQKYVYESHLYDGSPCINPPEYDERASNKLIQLKIADACGLSIPNTLASNDPAEIRSFIEKNKSVITKPLVGHIWLTPKGTRDVRPEIIQARDIISDAELSICGSIYQQLLRKDSDIRAIYMDGKVIAAEFFSEENAHIDYRLSLTNGTVRSTPIELPKSVTYSLERMCRELGVRFASVDFAKCGQDIFFLDLNPKGQFLFVETFNPQIKALAHFIDFILSFGGIHFDRSMLDNISLSKTPDEIINGNYYVRYSSHYVTIDERIYQEMPPEIVREI